MRNSIGRTALGVAVAAALLTLPAARAAMEFVPVGNAGNAADSTTYGSVGYNYNIGKYEVTLTQYTEFLNAVGTTDTYSLYNTSMGTDLNIAGIARSGVSGSYAYSVIGSGLHPVSYVSWFDAARFTNWLQNGQPTGLQVARTTERGAYTLDGAISGIITRNAGWTYGLPSEDEWYKAAYYDPNQGGPGVAGYWLYPTASNTDPNSRNGSAADPNSANFYYDDSIANGFNGGYAVTNSTSLSSSQNYLTDAGAFTLADSSYGTFDQGGNVWEWNDAVIGGSNRGLRGGSFFLDALRDLLGAVYRDNYVPTNEDSVLGFRVASISVPEPASALLLVLATLGLMARRRRRSGQ